MDLQTQTQQQAAPAQPQPLYNGTIWYRPQGKKTNFSARKSHILLYPGWLIVIDAETNQEYFRTDLPSDTKFVHSMGLGLVRIKFIHGKKVSIFKSAVQFPFYNIVNLIGLFLLAVLAGWFIPFGRLLIFGSLFFFLPARPRAKEFIQATQHAISSQPAPNQQQA